MSVCTRVTSATWPKLAAWIEAVSGVRWASETTPTRWVAPSGTWILYYRDGFLSWGDCPGYRHVTRVTWFDFVRTCMQEVPR